MLEGDVKVILKALSVKNVSYQEYGHVLNDILVLATDFCFCSFSHVKRVGKSRPFGNVILVMLFIFFENMCR